MIPNRNISGNIHRSHIIYNFNNNLDLEQQQTAICGIKVEPIIRVQEFNKTNIARCCMVCFKEYFVKLKLRKQYVSLVNSSLDE